MAHSSERTTLPPKPCVACGRPITWRKKWARDWANVKYCSDACRRRGTGGSIDASIETTILEMLAERAGGATICPSEVARRLAPDDWRTLMEPTRRAARRLVLAGRIVVTQGGVPVDAGLAVGPIRLKSAGCP